MSAHSSASTKAKRLRFAPLAIATGVLGAVLLSVSMSGTLSGFVASITNNTNTAASGTLVMQEQSTGSTPVTCLSTDGTSNGINGNASTCSTINKYGGSTAMTPGQTVTTAVTIKNVGTVAAGTFTLTPSACTQTTNGTINGSATDLCSQMTVVVTNTTTNVVVYSGTLAGFSAQKNLLSATVTSVPAGTSTGFSFAVTLPSTVGNTYQGLGVTQPLLWSFSS